MKTEWKIKDDDDDKGHLNTLFYLTGNEEQECVTEI